MLDSDATALISLAIMQFIGGGQKVKGAAMSPFGSGREILSNVVDGHQPATAS